MADLNKHPSGELGEKVERALQRAREAMERGRTEILKISKVGKMKFNTSKMQRDRAALFHRLGEKVFAMLKEGPFNPSEVQDYVVRIEQLTEKIESHQTQMKSDVRQGKT